MSVRVRAHVRVSYERMILDCVVEAEASLVICHAEHVFAIIAFQEETKRKLNQVKSNITVWRAVYRVFMFLCACVWRSSAVGANIESCSTVR